MMADPTLLTLLFVFGPPLIISAFLWFFGRSEHYRRISKILILVLLASSLMNVLELFANSYPSTSQWIGGARGVDEGVLAAQFGLAVFQSGSYALEQLLLWGFVAFFAVVIGSIYLLMTCALKKGGSLVDRMNQVSFKGSYENPLTSPIDVRGLQAYLIIGLVTMPSMISIMIGMQVAGVSPFSFSVVYYVLLFYRFSLMAYTRIASKAKLHFGKEDIGSKYEKRMLGRFTILNLMISAVSLGYTILTMGGGILGPLAQGMIIELKELLAAVLLLPFLEGFAALFFLRFWHFWSRLRTRVRKINLRLGIYSFGRGILVGGACFILFYAILAFMTASTTFFTVHLGEPTFNNQIGASELYKFLSSLDYLATPYSVFLLPILWSLVCLFLFQLIKVLLGGALTHRKNVAPEYSIIVSAITVAILIWLLMPATNFLLGASPVQLATDSGLSTYSYLLIPQPLLEEFVTVYYVVPAPSVLLYAVFLDFPIWIFGSLLLTYFFIFRRQLIPAKKEVDVFVSSDFFRLFISFCTVVVASIGTLFLISSATPFGTLAHDIVSKVWYPSARTILFFETIGPWYVFFHNMMRFLLTVFGPLLLWVSVVGIRKAWNGERVKYIRWYILTIILFGAEAIVFLDRFTYIAIIGIPIVLAALYRLFYRIVKGARPKTMYRTTLLKISFYSLILSEIYSTAIAIADRYMFVTLGGSSLTYAAGGNLGLLVFLLELIPHALVEIPAALLAGMIGLYVARRMTAKLDENEKNLDGFMTEGVKLLWSRKIWYPILYVTVFFAVAAAIEIYVAWGIMGPLANGFGFA